MNEHARWAMMISGCREGGGHSASDNAHPGRFVGVTTH